MRHSGAHLLTLIGLSVVSTGVAFGAATYYIAVDGSDTNDGLSSATPWRTIDKINSLGKSLADNSSFLFFANNRSHGIYPDRARNTSIKSNICYNNGSGAYQGSQLYLTGANGVTHNVDLAGNVLVSRAATQLAMRTDTAFAIGSYDNAVLCNPYKAGQIRNGSVELTLPQW